MSLELFTGSGEVVEGGVFYKAKVDPDKASSMGQGVLQLAEKYPGLFPVPLFRRYRDSVPVPLMLLKKAWVQNQATESLTSVNIPDVNEVIQPLVDLSDELDEKFGVTSVERCLIIYKERACWPTHTDDGAKIRFLNLIGSSNTQWHDTETDNISSRTNMTPGDVLYMNGETHHSVRNVGGGNRVVLGLIDSSTDI
jgi:hypothetical protein